ncbi:MAG: undecaprenyl/decaprenyl-phosphate alpha-N-acetylglucosaminyl 1-phosphate transferase [Pirellulaceae bacterium]|nr:undecaprenyl/decaprenyl-phosphate alpha-N-acetylglucosaminyl 1-phosphate transferase [Pirellulaceae bacterium]
MSTDNLLWLLVGTLLPTFLVACGATFLIRRLAPRWGLLDQPNHRKVHQQPTPLGGGVAIWLGVVLFFLAVQLVLWLATQERLPAGWLPELVQVHIGGLWKQSAALWVLLAAGTVLMVTGLIDDRRGLDWRIRLAIQFGVAGLCVFLQQWRFTMFVNLPLVTGLLSVFWIVGMINSFNMLDNMDGLSAGVAAIASAMLAAVLLMQPDERPQLFVAGFLLALVGALLGFLWHNRPPARIFMGDAGSYFIGFCIAVATLLASFANYDSPARHTVLAPLCVMAVPLYDMITVIWIRLREGRSPVQADKCHFSHRLVELGMSKGQAVATIYLTTATCGLGALLLQQVQTSGAVIIVLLILCVLALIAILESSARGRLKP